MAWLEALEIENEHFPAGFNMIFYSTLAINSIWSWQFPFGLELEINVIGQRNLKLTYQWSLFSPLRARKQAMWYMQIMCYMVMRCSC